MVRERGRGSDREFCYLCVIVFMQKELDEATDRWGVDVQKVEM